MSFWGVQVKWGEVVEVDPNEWPSDQLHISQATLWQSNKKFGRIGVKVTVLRDDEAEEDPRSEREIEEDEELDSEDEEKEEEDEEEDDEEKTSDDEEEEEPSVHEVLICSLKKEVQEFASLDLIFSEPFTLQLISPSDVSDEVIDDVSVHLSGYYMPGEVMGAGGLPGGIQSYLDDEAEEEEEEESEEEPEEMSEEDLRQVLERKRLARGMAKLRNRKRQVQFEDSDEEEEEEEGFGGDGAILDDSMEEEEDEEEGEGGVVFSNSNATAVRIIEVTDNEEAMKTAVVESSGMIVEEPPSPRVAPSAGQSHRGTVTFFAEAAEAQPQMNGGDASVPSVTASPDSSSKKKKKKDKKKAAQAAGGEGGTKANGVATGGDAKEVPTAKVDANKVATKQVPQKGAKGAGVPEASKKDSPKAAGGEGEKGGKGEKGESVKAKEESGAQKKQKQSQAGEGKEKGIKKETEKSKVDPKKAEKTKPTATAAGQEKEKGKVQEGAKKGGDVKGVTKEAKGGGGEGEVKVGVKRPAADAKEKAVQGAQKEKKPKSKRTFPNGLEIEELGMGKPDGKVAKGGKTVFVRYTGKLKSNGKVFDSNITKKPFKFRLGTGEVIKGWDVGLEGMRTGDKRRITIPPALGYGASGAPPSIPGNAWLLFDVELVDVK